MKKNELNKGIREFVKLVNENKEELGLTDDIMISPKLELKEIESHIESLGETIGDALGENVPEYFAEAYMNLAEGFDAYKKANPAGEAETSTAPEASGPAQAAAIKESAPPAQASNTMFTAPPADSEPKAQAAKPKTKKTAAPVAAPKSVVAADEKDKAIKKLFDLIGPDAVATMDPATMRTVLMVMK